MVYHHKRATEPSRALSGIPKKIYQGRNFFFKFFLLKANKGKHKHIPIQKHFWRATNPQGSKPLASPICCCKVLDIISASMGLPHTIIKDGYTTAKIRLSSTLPLPLFMSSEFVLSSLKKKIVLFLACSCLILKLIFLFYLQLWTNSTYALFICMVARQFHDMPAAYKLISGVCLHGAVTNGHLELSVVPLWGWAVTWTKATMWAVIWTSLPLAG